MMCIYVYLYIHFTYTTYGTYVTLHTHHGTYMMYTNVYPPKVEDLIHAMFNAACNVPCICNMLYETHCNMYDIHESCLLYMTYMSHVSYI